MPRFLPALCACVALGTMGCDLSPQIGSVDAPSASVETATLASNELARLGRQDLSAGNSGLAEDHFRGAVEHNSNDAYAWIGLAAAYDNLKRFDLADRAYAHAIFLKGETPSIMNNIGYSYYLRGDRKRALTELQHALALDPKNEVVLNNIRLVQSGEGPNRRAAP